MATAEDTKDLPAVLPAEGTALAAPEWLQVGDVRGTEDIGSEDVQMPRLSLAQKTSKQLEEGNPKLIPGLKICDLFNDLTRTIYGRGPLYFTVLRRDRPRWIEFIPLDEGGGIRDKDVPHDDPRTQWTTDEKGNGVGPKATKFYDFIVMLVPTREVIALSFKSTGLKVAKQLNGLMKMRNKPSFAGRYTLTTAMDPGTGKGAYAVYLVANAGWVSKDEYLYGETLFEGLRNRVINISRDTDPDAFDPGTFEATAGM
jgi:hypothetical protein